jgi:hypothetical protein
MNTLSKAVLCLFAFAILSCDKEFTTIGADIVAGDHFDFDEYILQNLETSLTGTGAVQSNNLPINSLGVYANTAFGSTKAHIVSQMELVTVNPDIGFNYEIDDVKDSVYIYIPYFSTSQSTSSDGVVTYKLDSINGNKTNGKIDLKIYENGYFLNSYDPNDGFISLQKQFTDQKSLLDFNVVSGPLNDITVPSESTAFTISKEEIIIYKTDGNGVKLNSSGNPASTASEYVVKERKAPGIWINLNKARFKQKILDEVANGKLLNNNIFKQHFKGLYFEVNNSGSDEGFIAKLDLTRAEVVMQYRSYATPQATLPSPSTATKKVMNFKIGFSQSGSNIRNTINVFETLNSQKYSDAIAGVNTQDTQDRLFVKGGDKGSIGFINLFGPDNNSNGVSDELDQIRAKGWMINEAILIFYVDQNQMAASNIAEPNRIYLYDATNSGGLADYFFDSSFNSFNTKLSKNIFNGIGVKNASGKIISYNFRLTEHIRNLVNATENTNTNNIKLGLVVTENINNIAFLNIKTPLTVGTTSISKVPTASVMNPLGTILYGPQVANGVNRLKLKIYYTEPK